MSQQKSQRKLLRIVSQIFSCFSLYSIRQISNFCASFGIKMKQKVGQRLSHLCKDSGLYVPYQGPLHRFSDSVTLHLFLFLLFIDWKKTESPLIFVQKWHCNDKLSHAWKSALCSGIHVCLASAWSCAQLASSWHLQLLIGTYL